MSGTKRHNYSEQDNPKELPNDHQQYHDHQCTEHCTHQYEESPIRTTDQLDDYVSDIKDLGLVLTRRQFVKRSSAAALAMIAGGSMFSFLAACANQLGQQTGGQTGQSGNSQVEKADLTVGFLPITCATPIIAAGPIGFYKKYGLNVTLKKFGGFAEIRDAFITGEIDAAHLLSPMTIALAMGLGSAKVPTRLAATENINGQAITMSMKHKGQLQEIQDLRGMTLGIPFEYSVHNFLLRHYLTQGGLDPEKDVTLRVTRPPDMIALTMSGNLDGFIVSDPFNQRAIKEEVGFLYKMTGDLWPNHPCCAFAVKQDFIEKYPKTYHALLTSIVDSTNYCAGTAHRADIADAIYGKQYLNQPQDVVQAVLTGKLNDGLGNVLNKPAYIDFDPFPWKSAAAWMISQMIRWEYIPPDQAAVLNIRKLVDEVYLSNDVRKVQKELGFPSPAEDYRAEAIMGKTFDMEHVREWTERFF